MQTTAHALASVPSKNNAVTGNKSVYGINLLHGVKLSEFPGIRFAMKLNTGDTTLLQDVYVTYTVSLQCDGNDWLNLVTTATDMGPSTTDADGYTSYGAAPAEVKWARSGSKPFPTTGLPVLLNAAINSTGGPLSLDALIAAYPKACIYNFPNSTAGGITPTPAVDFNLGDSRTITGKKAWIRRIAFGDKTVF